MRLPSSDSPAIIPREIWILGIVSLLMDFSSEMIHALLPLYITGVLGASVLTFGIIEGVAEAIALMTKLFSGVLSDFIRKRKLLATIGYGLSALTKPVFPLSTTIYGVVFARFTDRIGKGIRGAPRDAMVGEFAPPKLRGACFGLRQSLDTVGAVLGPLVAFSLLMFFGTDVRSVFWVACIPAIASAALIYLGVSEPRNTLKKQGNQSKSFHFSLLYDLPKQFWLILGVAFVLTLARFSEGFLILQASEVGFSIELVPLVLVVMNIFYAGSAYAAGKLSDRFGRKMILRAGIVVLFIADLVLASSTEKIFVISGVAIWGLHMGLTQGVISAMVADQISHKLLGTAFGLLNFAVGIAMLAGSVLAGLVWQLHGPHQTFLLGALFSLIAIIGSLKLSIEMR